MPCWAPRLAWGGSCNGGAASPMAAVASEPWGRDADPPQTRSVLGAGARRLPGRAQPPALVAAPGGTSACQAPGHTRPRLPPRPNPPKVNRPVLANVEATEKQKCVNKVRPLQESATWAIPSSLLSAPATAPSPSSARPEAGPARVAGGPAVRLSDGETEAPGGAMVQGRTWWPRRGLGLPGPRLASYPAGLLATAGPSRAVWTAGARRGE